MAFAKGTSGNPLGRPVGIKDRRSALRDALEGRAHDILEKAIAEAMEGNTPVLIALLSRLIPQLRPETLGVQITELPESPTERASYVTAAALSGSLSVSAANEILQGISQSVRIRESDEILLRLEKLEMGTPRHA